MQACMCALWLTLRPSLPGYTQAYLFRSLCSTPWVLSSEMFEVAGCLTFTGMTKYRTYTYNHFTALWTLSRTTGWGGTRRYISPFSGFSGEKGN